MARVRDRCALLPFLLSVSQSPQVEGNEGWDAPFSKDHLGCDSPRRPGSARNSFQS